MDKIHGGIGDRLSTFIQWTTSFFGGIVVGFVYDWRLTLVMLAGTPFLVISAAILVTVSFYVTEYKVTVTSKNCCLICA